MKDCLHLKTGCTYLGENTLLANRSWVDTTAMLGMEVIETHPDEPFARIRCVSVMR